VGIILEERGKHFDPDVVDAFLELEHKFREISRTHADA
jgi:putative two-component system response regulator